MTSKGSNPFSLTHGQRLALVCAFLVALVMLTAWTVSAGLATENLPAIPSGEGDTLVAEPPTSALLLPSYKAMSRPTLASGEMATCTIFLRNIGPVDVVAGVTDPIPPELTYVPDSVTSSGVYSPDLKTVAWRGITVPVHSAVPLSFRVTPASEVVKPTRVINTATIKVDNTSFDRQAWVMLVPSERPRAHLMGSYKAASRYLVGPGDVLTYTIRLHNSGKTDVIAQVTDPVPTPMSYISGSVTLGGQYDATTATLTWSAVTVPGGDSLSLSYAVTTPLSVMSPTLVTNVATITVGGDSFPRQARVLLLPEAPITDSIAPVVHGVAIDDQDVLTSPNVTLYISATDNVAVKWMVVREWSLDARPWPHWQAVRSGPWVPYQAEYTWTLTSESGAHFVGVWVADAAFNVSQTDRHALDFASLLLPGTAVGKFDLVPYLVHYAAGVNVSAVLTPTNGDADLYVWYPGNSGRPDQKSTHPLTATEVITFTTPHTGTYLILAYGYTAATYDLSITPGGGPQAWAMAATLNRETVQVDTDNPVVLMADPVLTLAGVDPLEDITAPSPGNTIYLPLVMK